MASQQVIFKKILTDAETGEPIVFIKMRVSVLTSRGGHYRTICEINGSPVKKQVWDARISKTHKAAA